MKIRLFGLLVALGASVLSPGARADLRDYAGVWVNTDRSARRIIRLHIRPRPDGLRIRVFAKCHPNDCDWGRTAATAYAGDASADIRRDVQALTAVYDKGFAETTLVIRLDRDGRLRVRAFTRFKDGGRRANYVETATFERGRERVERPRFREDCVPFDTDRIRVDFANGSWKIVEGRHWLMDFGSNERGAHQARRIIRRYGLDKHCFVGRPRPSMMYFLAGREIPAGPLRREDCVAFNPGRIDVRFVDGRWKIVEGRHWIMDFGRHEDEARDAFHVIRRYGATHQCFVGRPNAPMKYLRR